FTYGPKRTSVDESDSRPSEYASCESDSSVDTTTSMHDPVESEPKVICEPKVWTDAPIIEEYDSDSDSDSMSNVQEDKEKPNSRPSEYASCESDSSVDTTTSMHDPVESEPKVICEPKVWTDAPIIEEYDSDSDSDSMSNVQEDKEKPSFAFTYSDKHVKISRENVKETGTPNHYPKVEKQDRNGHTRRGLGYAFTRKACFVCGSFSHLIRDCDFHEKRMATP
nr:hypothetical protein [Tanacetum cinerariifolium]